MKISKKILVAAMAATLAATSMAAVASATATTTAAAEEKKVIDQKSYDIFTNYGTFDGSTGVWHAELNKDIAENLAQAYQQIIYFDSINVNNPYASVSAITLDVSGFVGSTATNDTFKFKKNDAGKWQLVVLDKSNPVVHEGEFASSRYDRITKMVLNVTVTQSAKIWNETSYNTYASGKFPIDLGKIVIVDDDDLNDITNGTEYKTLGSNADNVADLKWVKDEQADIEVTKIKAGATALATGTIPANVATNINNKTIGVLYGSKVLNAAAGGTTGTSAGNAFSSTQELYTLKGTTFNYATKTAAGDNISLQAVPTETEVTTAAPIVVNGVPKTSGYLYTLSDDGTGTIGGAVTAAGDAVYIYSETKVGATALAALVAGTTITMTTAGTIDAVATTATNALAVAAFGTSNTVYQTPTADTEDVVILEKFEKSDYDEVRSDDVTGADITAVANVKVLVYDAKNKTYKLEATRQAMDYQFQAFSASKIEEGKNSTAALLAYAFAKGGWYSAEKKYEDTLNGDTSYNRNANWTASNAKKNPVYGYLPRTTSSNGATILRDDVKVLSYTGDEQSQGRGYEEDLVWDEKTQSYKNNDMYLGTGANGFAGLASQVADFFNKSTDGAIRFTFTGQASAGGTSDAWSSGIPSTEVGLYGNTSSTEKRDNFALFFNYKNSTGTLYSSAKVDTTGNTVTVDISNVLDDLGGYTKGTIENIYYGLNVGNNNDPILGSSKYGLRVSKVELLKYEAKKADAAAANDEKEAAVTTTTAATTTTKATTTEIAIKDDEDEKVQPVDTTAATTTKAPETTAALIESETTTAAAQGNNSAPATTDNDTNPGTGVALAVVPAAIAAAAMVVSKKRK